MATFNKLLIMLLNVDLKNIPLLSAPFFQASAAASMNYDVSLVLNADAGILLKKGMAEKLFIKEGSSKTVYGFIRDAHEAGVKIYICSLSLEANQMTRDDLISECNDIIGSATYIAMAMEEDTQVLTY